MRGVLYDKSFLKFYYHDQYGWFRLFGVGLKWKHEKYALTYSERNRLKRKPIKVGKYFFFKLPQLCKKHDWDYTPDYIEKCTKCGKIQ